MRVPAAIGDRDLEALLCQRGCELIYKDILSTRIGQAGDDLPLVDTMIGDHQYVFPGGSKKGLMFLGIVYVHTSQGASKSIHR